MRKVSDFKEIAEYQLCCGCGVCSYLFPQEIKMIDSVNYGKRPLYINKLAVSHHDGLKYCPGVKLDRKKIKVNKSECIDSLYGEWGPVLKIYEGYAVDKEIRYKGSSGGGITALALYCLERRKFSGVLHVKMKDDQPLLNETIFSQTKEDLVSGAGSRYSPASPCDGLEKVKEAESQSLVIGKSCDIAGVFNVRCDDSVLDNKVGLTIACFCAGTPSTSGTMKMLEKMGISQDTLRTLRYRGHGWPGVTQAIDDKSKSEITYEQSWGGVLQKYRQWRCYICPDHAGEFADIAVGDPWYKDVADDDLGQSLIIARSRRGVDVVEGAIASGYLIAKVVDPEILPQSQINLKKARAALWGRLFALKMLGVPTPGYSNFGLFSSWVETLPLKMKIKSILGTVKRIFVKKLYKKQDVYPFLDE